MKYTADYLSTIGQIEAHVWDSLAQEATPFMRHGFLEALESSGCVQSKTGWCPHHMVIYSNDEPVGVLPLYLKSHSFGEYVFDQEWARAYHHYGVSYFPKLLSAIPFTPVPGLRLAISKAEPFESVLGFVLEEIQNLCKTQGYSSWHCLFTPTQETVNWQNSSLLQRKGVQFLWRNKGYETFDDYLVTMNSKKRKNLKRERRQIIDQGIEHIWVEASNMSESDWQHFYQCYSLTYLNRAQAPYLNLEFFQKIALIMADKMLFLIAKKGKQRIASSLFFVDNTTLYGRYWGCIETIEALHFETCYYQGIEYAIKNALEFFDAGTQGQHKISRGFEPIYTYSWHWIHSESFRKPIGGFLAHESHLVDQYRTSCEKLLPFK